MNRARHGTLIVVASLLFALLLSVMPLPAWLHTLRPLWLPLTLIYWVIALPHRYGIGTAFVCGLVLDVVGGNLLGLNALLLSLVSFFCLLSYSRLRMFTRAMQAAVVLALVGVTLVLRLWIVNSIDHLRIDFWYWLPALSSALAWFIWFPALRFLRRRFQVF